MSEKKQNAILIILSAILIPLLIWLFQKLEAHASLHRDWWTMYTVLINSVRVLPVIILVLIFRKRLLKPFMGHEKQFLDIDKENSAKITVGDIIKGFSGGDINTVNVFKNTLTSSNVDEQINAKLESLYEKELKKLGNFAMYFRSISRTLEKKADVADQKASNLLDKGVSCARWGIILYIFSIIIWQSIAWFAGWKPQLIYGIASCTVLFIFIEFLSGWFLKQYSSFVDTSTYMLKIKSIFDRYILTYYVLKEFHGDTETIAEHTHRIFDVLSEELKWPDSRIFYGNGDSFAKETLEALTRFTKAAKTIQTKDEDK